ncbi:hypothetical protein [Streptomyces sp. NBC_00120]|uniref:hypothetical protein n=1 Tax=Streptomyces sp. NBC_00120 TaxID=2975660 RepID=UPI00224DF3CB|nr:hypothetical protein [Streptomyces sp. NBC_00120]MCX5326328.1 hypothetical protein [Streptomyces sp. NBC_00120]
MDWISPVSGLVGALVGGGVSLYGTRMTLITQLDAQYRQTHMSLEQAAAAERGRITDLLAPRLVALIEHVREWRERPAIDPEHPNYPPYSGFEDEWLRRLMDAQLAALEIPRDDVRDLFTEAFESFRWWRSSTAAVRSPFDAMEDVIEYLVMCLFAFRRDVPVPEPTGGMEGARSGWEAWKADLGE